MGSIRVPLPGPWPAFAWVLALLLGAVSAGAEGGDPRESLRAGVAALGHGDPQERARGAARIRDAVASDPSLAVRALPSLREALRSRDGSIRALAVGLLARFPDPEPTRLWLERLDPEEDDRVIAVAVEGAAARREDVEVAKALIARARDGAAGPGARALALEALGHVSGPAARLVLRSPRPGADWVEESGRALGLGHTGDSGSVPALLDLLGHADPAPRAHAWESLVRLTGRNLPPERAAFESPPTEGAAPADRYVEPQPAHVPTYYGIPIPRARSHVCFCLDVSQSMWGEGIEHARKELVRALKSLPSAYAFDVVCFNEEVMPLFGRLALAHPVQKSRAIAWLEAKETVSYTNLFDAVERAFGYAGRGEHPAAEPVRLDAVFLLSDGAPNRGRLRGHDEVVEGIRALSDGTIPVHTIGAGEEVFPLLRRIAESTGGRFADAFDFP